MVIKSLSKFLLLSLTATLLFFFSTDYNAKAQSDAYSDGKSAQLDSAQKQKLLNLKAAIAIPTYVPAGFKLKDASGTRHKEGNISVVDYSITYENNKGATFTIESTNEGIGDVAVIKTITGRNPYFKNTVAVGPLDPEVEGPDSKGIYSQWIESKPAYQPPRSITQFYHLSSEGITKSEGLKIMLSLRYLK